MSMAPYAYDRSGELVVCADGPELIAYDGGTDEPIWKQFCDGILVGVGAVGRQRVYSLDTDGRLTRWRGADGQKELEIPLDAQAHGLSVSASGRCVAVIDGGLAFVSPEGDVSRVPLDGARVATWSPDGSTVGVGLEGGRLRVVHAGSGSTVCDVDVGGPPSGVAGTPQGRWIVAAGRRLSLVGSKKIQPPSPPDEPAPPPRVVWEVLHAWDVGQEISLAAASADGAVAATVAEAREVVLFELHENRRVGEIALSRDVHGLQFGPGGWLGIGLDNMDANRVEIMSGKVTQTQPGLGRRPDHWSCKPQVETAILRGARAAVGAAGASIAKQVEKKRFAIPGVTEEPGKKSNPMLRVLLGCGLLSVTCAGCSGCSGLLYYFW